MTDHQIFLPTPRQIERLDDLVELQDNRLIVLHSAHPQELVFTARRLQEALETYANLHWEISASSSVPEAETGIVLSVVPDAAYPRQGYQLSIRPDRVLAAASEPAGIFYAAATLIQLLAQHGQELPGLILRDWPDFPNRGVMLDISRDRVPKMETLYGLVDLLASWKVNQLQLYTEHTFAYRQHPEVWAAASPLTGEEILALDAYCRQRFIELVPNQNSFGHMRRWLKYPRYRPLAEIEEGWFETPWGIKMEAPYSLCPVDERSIALLRGLYDELLPHFQSRQFNVGCDETLDIGQGRSAEAVQQAGVGRVYLDFLRKIHREVRSRGCTMQFWGDIIIHHPDLIPELPHDVIALEWGYEADHPFAQNGAVFARSGIPFYVCPGTSSWNTIAGRTENATGNLLNAAENGLDHGAIGFLNTDWGDNGHWQPLPVSYLGFAYGAAVSWSCEASREMPLADALSRFAFNDRTGTMGQLAYDLGNVHQETGLQTHNSTVLYRLLRYRPDQLPELKQLIQDSDEIKAERFQQTYERIAALLQWMDAAQMQRPDADWIRDEFRWAARMLQHSCQRAVWMLGSRDNGWKETLASDIDQLMGEFEEIWMRRSRPGGFSDSLALMQQVKADYEPGDNQT